MAEVGQTIMNRTAPGILDHLLEELGHVCNVGHNVDKAVIALGKLQASRQDLLDDKERSPQKTQPVQADNWLKRVSDMETSIAKIQHDYSHRCLSVGSFSPNFISSYTISRRARRKLRNVNKLIEECNNLKDLKGVVLPASCISKPLPSVVVGKSLNLAKVLACLDDDKTGIISICGMAGVGKSELMRCVNNEFLPDAEKGASFNYVIWVDNASSDVKTVQDKIAQRLKLEYLGELDQDREGDTERRASPIFRVLMNASFLVLLDNLTSPVPLASIGIPNPIHRPSAQKQKVVLTTPFKKVSSIMGSRRRIDVECLSSDESWMLFTSTVGDSLVMGIREKEVAQECGGLPIALTKVGGAMTSKRQPEDWIITAKFLKGSRIHLIPGMERENTAMLQYLKNVYTHVLSNDIHNACFLCCALWPRGHSINKSELVDCWISLGFIRNASPDGAMMEGLSIISFLQDANLLLPGENGRDHVKLHPILRDMALWIARGCGEENKWMVHDYVNLNAEHKVIQLNDRAEVAERVSLMYSSIQELRHSSFSTTNFPRLAVLMLQHNKNFTSISGAFLLSAPALIYLDLSHTEVEELPEEIGTLLNLQHLNLSFTKIKALSTGLGNLEQLKHLLLRNTNHLSTISAGVFRSFPRLQVIDMYPSRYISWEDGEINRLEKMCSSTQFIESLGISINHWCTAKWLGSRVNVCTSRLLMTDFVCTPVVTLCPSVFKKEMGSFSILETLLEISIAQCDTLEQIVIDGEEEEGKRNERWCFQKLETLELRGLCRLKDVIWKRMSITFFLKAIRCVKIEGCNSLKNLSWVLQFKLLQHLELRNCTAMMSIVDDYEPQDSEEQPASFSHLMTIVLENLPMLSSVCIREVSFPSLEIIEVDHCVLLRRIPVKQQKNLREIRGSLDWWKHLEWDGDSNIEDLRSHFVDTSVKNAYQSCLPPDM